MRFTSSLFLALGASLFAGVSSASATGFNRAATNPTEFHDIINQFQQFARTEAQAINLEELGARRLDVNSLGVNSLQLTYTQDVDVYFINEGANYRNQLGMTSTGTTNFDQIIFNDITCTTNCSYNGYRAPSNQFGTPDGRALQVGDYYNVGTIQAGSSLDFYLGQGSYGKNPGKFNTWYTDTTRNSDKIQHLLAYEYQNYLVLGWEDMTNGGDLDYNDVVFVVDIGEANLDNIPTEGAPEPQEWMGVLLLIGLGWKLKGLKLKK